MIVLSAPDNSKNDAVGRMAGSDILPRLEDTKKLGFGLMRLPRKEGQIDVEQVKTMVDMFMEAGLTYFDTAWAYPGSEEAIRQALVERYPRDSFTLATKNAAWRCESREDAIAQLETSLERTGAGYIDYYLLHNLGESRTAYFDRYGIWDFAKEMKKAGKVKHIGFSFHSRAAELEKILEEHPEMEFVQLQINWADWESPTVESRKCYETARRYGKPIIVMEPVKGGMLANPPEKVRDILNRAGDGKSYASWAVRFAASLPGVATVLSGMSNIEQMADNLSYMKDFRPLDESEKKTISDARIALESMPIIPCTGCDYCAKVCPNDIGISGTFSAMNIVNLYGYSEFAKSQEIWLVKGHGRNPGTECIECGECEKVCPQHIDIREELKKAGAVFYPQ